MSPSLKILLLQARNPDDPAKTDERQSFARKAGLDEAQFVPHDLLSGPPALDRMGRFDAVMIGGSGDYYVSQQNLPYLPDTLDYLREVVATGQPMFASCFGFQLLVQALGGEIIYDPDNMEVGTYDLTLTEAGQQDELLGRLPDCFSAQLGRKDRAMRLPDSCLHLAESQRCPFQALRLPGQPIWATQFHPELSGTENKARFQRYLAGYAAAMSETERTSAFDRFGESRATERLIGRFLEVVFG